MTIKINLIDTSIELLNKIFHDERTDCFNLQTCIELLWEKKPEMKRNFSLVKIYAALKGRIELYDMIGEDYYQTREYLEKERKNDI